MTDRTRRVLLGASAVAWLVLLLIGTIWAVDDGERSLQARAEAALTAAGLDGVQVDIDGRDARVSGTTGVAEAVAIIDRLDGVRRVDLVLVAAGEPLSTTTTALPATTTAPVTTTVPPPTSTTTSTTVPAATSTTPPPTVATTTTSVPSTGPGARITATLSDGRLGLAGAVPDEATAAAVTTVADLIYGPFLDSSLQVDPALSPTPWLQAVPRAIGVLTILGDGRLEIGAAGMSISGGAATEGKRFQAEAALRFLLPDLELASSITVTGEAPPFYEATAPGDGTVTITGVMPAQDVVDGILGAAAQVFGAENVTSTLTTAPNVERNFSVFRIPLTFIQLAPIPQWTITIDDDRISGNLRGGATFAVGSADLTPQLVVLLDTAAGIMLRNPTLSITIEGHTDTQGSRVANQVLSEQRAANAAAYLVGLGIEPDRVTAVGYGESSPLTTDTSPEGRAQNRRIEFLFGPGGEN